MRKRIFSRLMAMFMAVALLSTTAFAAVFTQDSIDEDGNLRLTEDNDYNYHLESDVELEQTVKIGSGVDAAIDLNGWTLRHTGETGSVIAVADGGKLTLNDTAENENHNEDGVGTVTGGKGTWDNNGWGDTNHGGGVYVRGEGSSLVMNGGNITGNEVTFISEQTYGGGVSIECGASFTMNGGAITANKAFAGGGVMVDTDAVFILNDGLIADNRANLGGGVGSTGTVIMHGGAVRDNSALDEYVTDDGQPFESYKAGGGFFFEGGSLTIDGGSVTNNIAGIGGGICALTYSDFITTVAITGGCICNNEETGETVDYFEEEGIEPIAIENRDHTPGETVRENEVSATIGAPGSYDEVIYCTVCHTELSRESHDIEALPVPPASDIDFGDGFPGGAGTGADTTIDDEATPLAGIVTEAQLLDALYQHEGSPEVELVEKYASHEYAPAISWALANTVEVDDQDFDPDEVVTVVLLLEVLVNFVEYKGVEFTVTVDGEDEDLVMDLSERLNAFFSQLEK